MSDAFWVAVLCAAVGFFCYRAGWIDGYWTRADEDLKGKEDEKC